MGISASIASKKYQLQDAATQSQDGDDGLSSVDSFRPNSPFAHPQARAATPNGHLPPAQPRVLGFHGYGGNGSRGSTISSVPPFSSMYQVRDFLIHNPELLCNKKKKKVKASELMLPMEQKQIKTKQGIYLGLINPPMIYGAGVNSYSNGGRLKVNQKLYLGLVYPTIHNPMYREPHIRPQPPLRSPQEMIVVRKDANSVQNPPKNIRQRKPLPPPESTKSKSGTNSLPRMRQEMIVERISAHQDHRAASLPRTPGKGRGSNDYVDPPEIARKDVLNPTRQTQSVRLPYTGSHGSYSKTSTLDSRYSRNGTKNVDSKVEFTFNVDELNLRRRNGANNFVQRHAERGPVKPLYFRKSLAYSPRYDNGREMLSAPL